VAQAQGGSSQPARAPQQGGTAPLSREQMWYAPTAEDWAKPCLISWQRNYEDAMRVAEETGKPILVCINMDGEIASEHYAGIRYRQPEIARLYEPYVTVIASVYRHNPRDYDDAGNRILCPRFGSVTCGEHIRIEPGLFNKFLDDTRVAPRHIMVENGTEEQYDVYYAFDTDSVFNTIKEGIDNRPPAQPTVDRGDQSLVQRVDSRDVLDRTAIEQAYVEGDRVLKRSLLLKAAEATSLTQVDLLRLALFDGDPELSQLAWKALIKTSSPEAIDLITEVLRFPLEQDEQGPLVDALERIGQVSPRAARLASVHRGLSGPALGIDQLAWTRALELPPAEGGLTAIHLLRERAEIVTARVLERPDDAAQQLELALILYDLAVHPDLTPKLAGTIMGDARAAALQAKAKGATGWDVNSVIAATAKGRWRNRGGYEAAIDAVRDVPRDVHNLRARETLALFAEARQRAIFRALVRKTDWPTSWLADAHAAFELLAIHPLGTDQDVVEHHDYLKALEARGYANRSLDRSFERFPDSALLHDRLRARLLDEKELDSLVGLEATYEAMLRDQDPETLGENSNLHWYAGYASFIAAEFHRRAGSSSQAQAAYGRAIGHYEDSLTANPARSDSCDHYIALAHAGRARLHLEFRDYEEAVEQLLVCFEREPLAADNLDGLGITPVMTATTLQSRLEENSLDDLLARLSTALAALPPEVLEPPDFERVAPGTGEAGRRGLSPRGGGERRQRRGGR
jgi:tetratricopeptide (TPR) repeat protein